MRACGSYNDFHDRGLLLTSKLLNQGFLVVKLKSSLRKFYGCHHDLVNSHGLSVSQMNKCSICRNHNPALSSFMTYHGVCNKNNTLGVTCGAGTAHLSRTAEFAPVLLFLVGFVLFMLSNYMSSGFKFRVVMSATISA